MDMTRRDLIVTASASAAVLRAQEEKKVQRKGRLKQGVTSGVFGRQMSFEDRCMHAARLGAVCFDLVQPAQWPIVQKYGLLPNMTPGGGKLTDACNDKTLHAEIEKQFRENLPMAAKAGVRTVITFSGNRRGKSDAEGLDNCYEILKKVAPIAEDQGVTICMELLNSKVNHKDYQCDHTAWGVELCKRVNSPRFKLLYDIYHMQIMEGDVIRTIRDNIQYIAHFHTAGNPGRHEFDDTQELNYRGIAQAIVDTGYTGFLSHEYSPLKDPLTSLDQALTICDV
jgi:hydroxypyruvate isomerase